MSIDDERSKIMQLIGQLERRIDVHDGKHQRLENVPETLEKIDRRMWEGDKAIKELGSKIDANTAVTSQIRDAQVAGRVVNGVGKWAGAVILGALTLWAAIKGFKFP
jgi:hypothetical protein